jgi:hypothetical protein
MNDLLPTCKTIKLDSKGILRGTTSSIFAAHLVRQSLVHMVDLQDGWRVARESILLLPSVKIPSTQ